MTTKHKTRISALLPALLTEEVQRAAVRERVPQGRIIENALRDWLRKRLVKDAKKIARTRFDDLPSENEWRFLQSNIE